MIESNFTKVYLIKNDLDKSVFLKNFLNDSDKDFILAISESISKEKLENYRTVELDNFDEPQNYIYYLFRKIKHDWLIILKPEEKIRNQIINLTPNNYFVNIEEFAKNKDLNNVYIDSRLYNRYFYKKEFKNFSNISIANFENSFPEIKMYKGILVKSNFASNVNILESLLFILENNMVKISSEEILAFYTKYEDNSPNSLSLIKFLVKSYMSDKNIEKAKNIIALGLTKFPDSISLKSFIAEIYFSEKNYDNALTFSLSIVQMLKNKSYYPFEKMPKMLKGFYSYYLLGSIFYEKGEYLKAKLAFQESLDSNQSFKPSIQGLKNSIAKIENDENSINELNHSCNMSGNCCRGFNVNITHTDVKKIIENRPDLKINDFVEVKYHNEGNHYLFNLKKQKDSIDCIFLEENKCLINNFKPMTCSIWPFSLRGEDSILWETSHRKFIKKHCHYKIVDNSNDKEKMIKLIKDHENSLKEMVLLFNNWDKPIENNKEINQDLYDYFFTK